MRCNAGCSILHTCSQCTSAASLQSFLGPRVRIHDTMTSGFQLPSPIMSHMHAKSKNPTAWMDACDIIFSICALVTRTFENIAYAYSLESRWSDRNNWYLKAHFFIYSLIFFTTQITSTFRVFPASCSSAAELSRCSKRGKFEWCLKAMNLQCLFFPPLTSPRHSGFSQLLSALKQLILKLKTWGAASDNDHLTIICWHKKKVFLLAHTSQNCTCRHV